MSSADAGDLKAMREARFALFGRIRRITGFLENHLADEYGEREFDVVVDAVFPDGRDPAGEVVMPDSLEDFLKEEIVNDLLPLLVELDRTAPLERDPGNDVWETLRINVNARSGVTYLSVRNALGDMESVTTTGVSTESAEEFNGWCECRLLSETQDSSWDAARAERRVVESESGWFQVIDRGANRIIDIIRSQGVETLSSCEGHPDHGYVTIRGEGSERLAALFGEIGWTVDTSSTPGDGITVVRMPHVHDVHGRDRRWREVCAFLEQRLDLVDAPSPAPGP